MINFFTRWNVLDQLKPRLVQAQFGVPVAQLVAEREDAFGFQQVSELLNVLSAHVVEPLLLGVAVDTYFLLLRFLHSIKLTWFLLGFLVSDTTVVIKKQHGLQPA